MSRDWATTRKASEEHDGLTHLAMVTCAGTRQAGLSARMYAGEGVDSWWATSSGMVEQTGVTVLFATSTGDKRRWPENGGTEGDSAARSAPARHPSGTTCARRAAPLIARAPPSGTGRERSPQRRGARAVASAEEREIWRYLGGASRSPRPTAAGPQPQLPTAAAALCGEWLQTMALVAPPCGY